MGTQAHTTLVNGILARLTVRKGLTLWKLPTGVGRSLYGGRVLKFGIRGGTDIIGIAAPSGTWISIEAKIRYAHSRDTLRPAQRTFRDIIIEHGGIHIVAYTVDEAEQELDRELDRKRDGGYKLRA